MQAALDELEVSAWYDLKPVDEVNADEQEFHFKSLPVNAVSHVSTPKPLTLQVEVVSFVPKWEVVSYEDLFCSDVLAFV